jgi:hypothetical protein
MSSLVFSLRIAPQPFGPRPAAASQIELQIARAAGLPSHHQSVFRNLPAVGSPFQMIGVVTANIPDRLSWLLLGREVARLHVTQTDGFVAFHLNVIVGEKVLGHLEAADNLIHALGEVIGFDNLPETSRTGGGRKENVDLVGKERTKELQIARAAATG